MADYESLRQAHVNHFLGLLLELVQRVSWPRDRIEEEQTQALLIVETPRRRIHDLTSPHIDPHDIANVVAYTLREQAG